MITWKRGSIEIVGEILKSLRENSLKKSHIANKCNLDARSVNKYLEIIISLDFVKTSKDMKYFSITQHGIIFLEKYHNLTKYFEKDLHLNEELEDSNLTQDEIKNYTKNNPKLN